MNFMARIVPSFSYIWESLKALILPGAREETEESPDEPPLKRRRTDDRFLLGLPKHFSTGVHPLHKEFQRDGFLLPSCESTFNFSVKLKRKSQLESPDQSSVNFKGYGTSPGITEKSAEEAGKENIITLTDDEDLNENGLSKTKPTEFTDAPGTPVIDLVESEKTERENWLDAESMCQVVGSKDKKNDKENNAQQLKMVAPSFLGKRNRSSGKIFAAPPNLMMRSEMSGGGSGGSLKRPNSGSPSSLCSSTSSVGGRKLPMMNVSLQLFEREKYSELLQKYTGSSVFRQPSSPVIPGKPPPFSFSCSSRKTFGGKVEYIDLTSQAEDEARSTTASSDKMGNVSEIPDPPPCSELRKKVDKCNVYDVSWVEELTKMYSRKDRENRKRIMDQKVKTALSSKESNQLLNEILEERVRVHLRLTEVAIEEGPVPIAEDEVKLPELTPDMEKRVAYAFKSGPGGEVLVEAFSLRITRRDMHTLVGTNWLNDEIINFYMNLLIERGKLDNYPSVYCFNTFFYPKLESQGHASLKRWTRKIDIFANELLIVPVHLGVHWCLACIDINGKKILYFDSMGGRNNTCLQNLMKYLQAECADKKKMKFETAGWELENVKDNPQQMNGSDCGMFSCMYAEYLCRRAKISFSQTDMPYFRRKMAYEILTKKLMM